MYPYRFRSRASLVLAAHRVRVKDIAAALELTPSAVSMQLAGRRRPHPSLHAVLRALVGSEAAEEIRRLLSEGGRQ